MANKSLTDLTARTATADTDLIHVNSGGTDYKEEKLNFLQGGLAVDWATNSLLTSQVNALPKGSYFGVILSNGHQTETGIPQNASFYVHAFNYSNASGIIYITQMNNGDSYYIRKYQSTWESSWTKEPTRSEITSLNNSLTNKTMIPVSIVSERGTFLSGGYCMVGNIVILHFTFRASSTASNSPSITSTPPYATCDTALSCIDITSGISSAITDSIPAGISTVGTVYVKNITTDHIYAVSGTYIRP